MTRSALTDDLAMAFATGSLPAPFAAVVATHCALSTEARALVGAYEHLGGAILDSTDPIDLSPSALAQVMSRINGVESETPRPPEPDSLFPRPLRDLVGGGPEAVRWKSVGGGVKQAILTHDGINSLRLLSIPPGVAMPEHGHRGLELTLVLQGAFSDGSARFERGDLEIASAEDQHVPVAEPGGPCICLAATDAPLRFVTLLPKLLQRLIRI